LWLSGVACVRAFPAIIVKVTIKKVQLSTLATVFSILSPTDSFFYSLFSLNIILCERRERERERERESERRKGREKKIKNCL
jgi:hypothetical protein